MDLPSLYTTEGQDHSSSETSGKGGERDIDNLDILGPNNDDLLVPTSELRDFVKTPFKLTREGRQRVQNLRPSNRKGARLEQNPETPTRLEQNPETPTRLEQNPETPVRVVRTQAESNTPIQPEKKGPLSKLLAFISLPEDQFKFRTPKNNHNEVEEQEQTDFSVLNPQRTNIVSPEFIHNQSYEDNEREKLQFNTYN